MAEGYGRRVPTYDPAVSIRPDEQLTAAIHEAVTALRPATERDWGVPAGQLRWTCARTARHMADDLAAYAGQLVCEVPDHYLPFRLVANPKTPPDGVLDLVQMTAGLLALVVRDAPADARGYHPYGMADAEGFAALGAAEVVLHTHDIARGLGVQYEPSREIPAWLLTRLDRDLPDHDDPWELLLWATGRGELPGHDPVRRWRWDPAPAT